MVAMVGRTLNGWKDNSVSAGIPQPPLAMQGPIRSGAERQSSPDPCPSMQQTSIHSLKQCSGIRPLSETSHVQSRGSSPAVEEAWHAASTRDIPSSFHGAALAQVDSFAGEASDASLLSLFQA
jgi:hypothetical protein